MMADGGKIIQPCQCPFGDENDGRIARDAVRELPELKRLLAGMRLTLYGRDGRNGLVGDMTRMNTHIRIQTYLWGAIAVAVITGVVGLLFTH